ncbi:cytochrome c [Candidatus Halobeggiatoa sp. HSG11]|nr:cytochrome c [Candidatus Halobeggiatoa sp. HSG11]
MKIVLSYLVGIVFVSLNMAVIAAEHVTPTAPDDYLAMENPIEEDDVDDDLLKKAKRLYKSKCKKCHGMEGDGQGSAAEDIEIKPTAFNPAGYMAGKKDGQLFWIMKNGSKGTEMEAFGPDSDAGLSEEKLWELIAYMRNKFTN